MTIVKDFAPKVYYKLILFIVKMGCQGSKDVQYQYKMEKRTIPQKEAITLHRWSLGAQARLKVLKMKRDLMKEIACK